MAHLKRILCPIDFSESSLAAFEYADDLASWANAEVVLVHAFLQPAAYDHAGQWTPADAKITEDLKAIASEHGNVKIKRITHAGMPDDVICWAAENQNCDMIVMGTHGRTGLKHLLFGSTAESVLRRTRCPVLTIRPQPQDQEPLPEPIVSPMPAPRYM